jgi:hypothetical protein
MWGLWQLYFNIEIFHQVIDDFITLVKDAIERTFGPVMHFVWRAFDDLEAWLVWWTEQFNAWLRPIKLVLQPMVTVAVSALAPLMRLGGTLLWMLYTPVRLLVGVLQPICQRIATLLQPIWTALHCIR